MYRSQHHLCDSCGHTYDIGFDICPAISLKENIQLTGNSEDGWTIVRD